MRLIARSAPALLSTLLAAAPASALEGVVLLPDGSPAVDATVAVLGRTGSTRTGPDGRFTWTPDPVPPFEVLVVLAGGLYTRPVLVESLPEDGSPVTVRVEAALTEAVTVEAGTTPFTEAPPANAATIVGRRDLEHRRPETLAAALESIPGVAALDEGHTAVPSIRGLARGRTLILIDGARVTAERRAGPSATFLDPFFLETIEVSRGFGSVAYGSDAFGGVIHARTRHPVPGSGWQGRAQASAGAGIPERAGGVLLARGLDQGGLLVQGRYRRADDYDTPQGPGINSGFRDWGVHARGTHEWGPGRLSVAWQTDQGRDVGKPAADAHLVRSFYPREDSHRLTASYEGDPRGRLTRWSAEAFLGWYRLVTDRDRLATAEAPRELGRSDVRARDYGFRVSGAASAGNWRVQGGLDLNGRADLRAISIDESFDRAGLLAERSAELSIADAARRDVGLYASVDGALQPWLSASAGARLDHVTTRNEGGFFGDRRTAADATSGFVALTAGPWQGITATGQVGRGFRDATLSDRYFRGVGGRGFVTGLPELEPERSLQYDVAVRRSGRVRAALYLYRYRIDDLIERFRDGDDFLFRNRGRALLRGVELEAQADVAEAGLTLELGAQAARGEAEDGSPLSDVPAESLLLTARKTLGERGHLLLRATLRAADDEAGPTEKPVPGHVLLDAAAGWRFARGLEARLLVRNLTDRTYVSTADELAGLAPGLSAMLTLSAVF